MPKPIDHGPYDTAPHNREALELLREIELDEYDVPDVERDEEETHG